MWGHLAYVICLTPGTTPDSLRDMNQALRADLDQLSRLAFHRAEKGRHHIRRFHSLSKQKRLHPDYPSLQRFYPWLLVPLSLWPIDVDGLASHLFDLIDSRQRFDDKTKLLLTQLGAPPTSTAQEVVRWHEHQVQTGSYESLIRQQHKFDAMERELADNPDFRDDWNALKEQFDIARYQNKKKIVRRRMVQERNFRTNWGFCWRKRREQFQIVFDAFCHRWNLYGMEGEKPLLLKLTVNLTPYGTMIVVPSYWSLDAKRDLNWKAINDLHRARGVERQGPKLTAIRQARLEDAKRVRRLWQQAGSEGLRGQARMRWLIERLGWHSATDESKIKRLLRLPVQAEV